MKTAQPLYPDLHVNYDLPEYVDEKSFIEPHPPTEKYPISLLVDELHMMAEKGESAESIKDAIKQNGYEIDSLDESNFNLLHYAVREKYNALAKNLVNLGADKNLVDGNGYTPLKIAESNDNKKLIELLSKDCSNNQLQPEYVETTNYQPRQLTKLEMEIAITGIKILGHLIIGIIEVTSAAISNMFYKNSSITPVSQSDIIESKSAIFNYLDKTFAKNFKHIDKFDSNNISIILKAVGADGTQIKKIYNSTDINIRDAADILESLTSPNIQISFDAQSDKNKYHAIETKSFFNIVEGETLSIAGQCNDLVENVLVDNIDSQSDYHSII